MFLLMISPVDVDEVKLKINDEKLRKRKTKQHGQRRQTKDNEDLTVEANFEETTTRRRT
jgi:hypothetical protein